jgi:hypothetical protein
MFVNGSKMSNLYRGPSIDATYHVSVHLAKANQQQELPVPTMFAKGSGLNEQSL